MITYSIFDDLKGAGNLPDFPVDYVPKTIEIFDQLGLLAGIVNGKIAYSCPRSQEHSCTYLAWYLDGELGFFYVVLNQKILLNRLTNLAVRYQLFKG